MNNQSLILSKPELEELTNRVMHSAQKKQLRSMMIDFKERADGSLVVFRHTIIPESNIKKDSKGSNMNLNAI